MRRRPLQRRGATRAPAAALFAAIVLLSVASVGCQSRWPADEAPVIALPR